MGVFLDDPNIFKEVVLGPITKISPDSKMFTFLLPSETMALGISVGEHVVLRALVYTEKHPQGKLIKRKYSPTSKTDLLGRFEIPIKVYYPTDTFEGGALTCYLDKLQPGDKIEVSGPKGKYLYKGNGLCHMIRNNLFIQTNKLGFIAGGTGITPCFQYIQYIIDHNENIELSLIFANRTEKDILLKEALDYYASTSKVKVYYTISQYNENWEYGKGHVNEEMIVTHLPEPGESTHIFFCGPSPMNRMLKDLLSRLGYRNTKF